MKKTSQVKSSKVHRYKSNNCLTQIEFTVISFYIGRESTRHSLECKLALVCNQRGLILTLGVTNFLWMFALKKMWWRNFISSVITSLLFCSYLFYIWLFVIRFWSEAVWHALDGSVHLYSIYLPNPQMLLLWI